MGVLFGDRLLNPPARMTPTADVSAPPTARPEQPCYSGCDAARAAGVAPIHEGEPGYREEMDGDGDGIACEPHRTS